MNRKASFTVEATFVMLIVVWVVLVLVYSSFYLHDRVVLASDLQFHLQMDEVEQSTIQEKMQSRLFLIDLNDIKQEDGLLSLGATARYHITIRDQWIKMMLLHGGEKGEYHVEKDRASQAELMWDATVIDSE